MVKAAMETRIKTVVLYTKGGRTAKELSSLYGVSERTLRRWYSQYQNQGIEGLEPKKTLPKRFGNATPQYWIRRIISIKRKYPAWVARRIKYQFSLPIHWTTAHRILKQNGLLFRIKAKPQPCRRFQRKHVDSLWQGDTFQFRIHDVGKVYVTGFTDDCSRFRVRSKTYLRKGKEEAINCLQWALRPAESPKPSIWTTERSSLPSFSRQKQRNTG